MLPNYEYAYQKIAQKQPSDTGFINCIHRMQLRWKSYRAARAAILRNCSKQNEGKQLFFKRGLV